MIFKAFLALVFGQEHPEFSFWCIHNYIKCHNYIVFCINEYFMECLIQKFRLLKCLHSFCFNLKEHFYDPKSNQGYISWRLKTVSRQSKPHSTRNARSSATSDNEGSGGPTAHRVNWNHLEKQLEGDQCKEAIYFMNHCTEKDQIFEKMKLTFKHRQQLIHDAIKSNTVFSVFPRFLNTKALVRYR